jgi:hypothetical protein
MYDNNVVVQLVACLLMMDAALFYESAPHS